MDYFKANKLAMPLLLLSSFLTSAANDRAKRVDFVSGRQEQEIVFKPGSAGSGRTKDGSRFSFTEWEGSGVWLTFWTEKRRSPTHARTALRAILRGKEVLERGTKLNNRGENVGERVILRFRSKAGYGEQNMIAWTDGSDFHYLQSSVLKNILAFEKQMIKTERQLETSKSRTTTSIRN